MLDGDDSIVLVHYLAGNSAARLHAAKARAVAASAGHGATGDRCAARPQSLESTIMQDLIDANPMRFL